MAEAMADMESGRPVPAYWPRTAAEAAAAFGYGTWASIWQCDEASDDLIDSVGGISLADTGTTVYRQTGALPNDFAVTGGVGADFTALSSTSYDITTTGQVAFYACLKLQVKQADYLFGKHGGTGGYYAVRTDASGFMHLETWDGTTTRTSSVSVDHLTGGYVDVLAMIDRTNGAQLLATNLGVSSSTDISAALTMTSTAPVRLGLALANSPLYAYAAIANAGVNNLRANAAAAITNIRRFTRRA